MAADIVKLIALTYCVSLSVVMVTEYWLSFIQDLNEKKYVSNRTNPSIRQTSIANFTSEI